VGEMIGQPGPVSQLLALQVIGITGSKGRLGRMHDADAARRTIKQQKAGSITSRYFLYYIQANLNGINSGVRIQVLEVDRQLGKNDIKAPCGARTIKGALQTR